MAKRQQEAYCDVLGNIHLIHLWADEPVIEWVKQMVEVNEVNPSIPGCYNVAVDPRYNAWHVAKEIEAVANRLRRRRVPGWLFKVMRAQ